ncbi:hypothetical protein ACWKWU_09020 [Chitinophaga lutea]
MQPSNLENRLQHVISSFLNQMHEAGSPFVSYITVTVHGDRHFFSETHKINAMDLGKIPGEGHLEYQEMSVDAAIPNTVVMVATRRRMLR